MKRARKQYTTQLLPKWRMVDNHWLIRTSTVLLLGIIKAGWRYGFVASLEDGSRVYRDMGSKHLGELKFEVPDKTAFLWLVVSGAPTEHWAIPKARGN